MNPLLIESGQRQWCDQVVVVDVPVAVQLSRTMVRDNNSEAQVQAIIDAQASREERLGAADFVLTNDRSLARLQAQVEQLHNKLLDRCQTHPE